MTDNLTGFVWREQTLEQWWSLVFLPYIYIDRCNKIPEVGQNTYTTLMIVGLKLTILRLYRLLFTWLFMTLRKLYSVYNKWHLDFVQKKSLKKNHCLQQWPEWNRTKFELIFLFRRMIPCSFALFFYSNNPSLFLIGEKYCCITVVNLWETI